MSESKPEDVELLPDESRLTSAPAAISLARLFGGRANFLKSVLVFGSLSALRVDSKGFVRYRSKGAESEGGDIRWDFEP